MFTAQVLVGSSIKLHKEIMQIENNMVKNPNWQEANQLAIYNRGRGVELGATEKQLHLVVRAGLEPGTTGFQVQRPDTRLRCLLTSDWPALYKAYIKVLWLCHVKFMGELILGL